MIQYYTALGRYELRTNDRGEKHPVLISSRQEYAPVRAKGTGPEGKI